MKGVACETSEGVDVICVCVCEGVGVAKLVKLDQASTCVLKTGCWEGLGIRSNSYIVSS